MADSRTSFDRWVKEVGAGAVAGLVDAVGGRGFVRANEEPVDAARRLLAEPDAASHIAESLPPLAKEVFFHLLDCGGVTRADLLVELVARKSSSSEAEVTKHAQILARRGLVLFTRHSWMWTLYQPTYVRGVFAETLEQWRRIARPSNEALVADDAHAVPIAATLGPLLAAVAGEPLRLTQARRVFRRHRVKLQALFGGESERMEATLRYAEGANWLVHRDGHRCIDREAVARFAASTGDAKLAFHLAILERCWPGAFQALAILSRESPDEWIPLDRLIARIDILARLRGGCVSPYDVAASFSFWTNELRVAAGIGLVEIAGPNGRPEAVRPTRNCRALVDLEELPHAPTEPGKPILVQPNFDVFVSPSAPLDVWSRLGGIARLVAVDQLSRFAIDAASVRQGVANGETAASVLTFLGEQSLHGIPQNVEATVRGWAEQAGAIRFFRGLVVRCDAERDSAVVRATGGSEISPGTFVFDEDDEGRVRAALAKAGHRGLPATVEQDPYAIAEEPVTSDQVVARFTSLRNHSETIEVQVDEASLSAADEASLARLLARAYGREEASRLLAALRSDEISHFESLIPGNGALYVARAVQRRVIEKANAPTPSLTDADEIQRTLERLVESPDETEVRIEYARNRNTAPQSFRIAPMDLFERGGTAFVEAYDMGSDETRLFEIARIRSLTFVDDAS